MKGSYEDCSDAKPQSPPELLQACNTKLDQPMAKATAEGPLTSGKNKEFGALKCGPIPAMDCCTTSCRSNGVATKTRLMS